MERDGREGGDLMRTVILVCAEWLAFWTFMATAIAAGHYLFVRVERWLPVVVLGGTAPLVLLVAPAYAVAQVHSDSGLLPLGIGALLGGGARILNSTTTANFSRQALVSLAVTGAVGFIYPLYGPLPFPEDASGIQKGVIMALIAFATDSLQVGIIQKRLIGLPAAELAASAKLAGKTGKKKAAIKSAVNAVLMTTRLRRKKAK